MRRIHLTRPAGAHEAKSRLIWHINTSEGCQGPAAASSACQSRVKPSTSPLPSCAQYPPPRFSESQGPEANCAVTQTLLADGRASHGSGPAPSLT